jgi:hypothetical protein
MTMIGSTITEGVTLYVVRPRVACSTVASPAAAATLSTDTDPEPPVCVVRHRSKSSIQMQQQECFAVQPGLDGRLDVARKVYVQTIEEIHKLAEQYSSECACDVARARRVRRASHSSGCAGKCGVRVVVTAARGYHISMPSTVEELPVGIVYAVRSKKHVVASTEDLISLNNRVSVSAVIRDARCRSSGYQLGCIGLKIGARGSRRSHWLTFTA